MRVLLIYLEPLDNEPMGLMYIGTVLKRESHRVRIIGLGKSTFLKSLSREVLRFKPDIVGLNITTMLAGKAEIAASFIKNNFPGIKIIAGGPHPTILPYETLKNKNIDISVIGEGELTIVDLLRAIELKRPLEKVKGIAFLKDNNLVTTEKREYIQDLDALPFVDRELMPGRVIYGRAGYPVGNPCMLLMTVRGCPYKCSFCQPVLNKMFGSKIRRRSVENVVREITELKRKYGIRGLWIDDDTFLLDNNWVERFCDLMIEEKLDMLWYTNGRINIADKKILRKMRDAGCVGLVMTPETGSERIRNEILNKNISDEEITAAYRICREIGLPVQANIMLGSPTETNKDLDLSVNLIKKIQPHFMNFSYTTALPETYLYNRYRKEISESPYYKNYEAYDIGAFKKLETSASDDKLREVLAFFKKFYSKSSFTNRARHFFEFPYFRRILFKRWRSLIFNKHPNFKHLIFDLAAILAGSVLYFRHRNVYNQLPPTRW